MKATKIIETFMRRCCERQDFMRTKSIPNAFKCKRCGNMWEKESYIDAAGGRDTRWIRWFPRDNTSEEKG
jgi:hypothetical protein